MVTPAMKLTASAFTPNAKPFTPGGMGKPAPAAKPREPTPPPKDMIVDKFTKWTHTERETNDFKEIVKKLATRKFDEPISMDIFK
tara:strand:+ start:1284 stop:1538 length:255 start_codon:yes stop_codon:yes gene_type:complete